MEIRLNSSKLEFKVNHSKIFQNLFDFNWGSVMTEILNVDASLECKAFNLLYNVTRTTNLQLSKSLGQNQIDKAENLYAISENIALEWKDYFEQDVTITRHFFENAIHHNPEYLTKSYALFDKFLTNLNIKVPQNLHYKYYQDFRHNLAIEYQQNTEYYKDLVSYFDNPIVEQNDRLDSQLSHYYEIGNFYTNSLQSGIEGSTETLKDLYIEPFFKIHKQNIKDIDENNLDFISPDVKINIHEFLNKHFLVDNPLAQCRDEYNMIFVLGQPGQGKTSFCYRIIYDILQDSYGIPDHPLYFIKIRDLIAKDFVDDTFNTINRAINQSLNFTTDKCLLILDGLDEAYMSGGLNDTDLKNLYERLNKTSKSNKNLKIILTSRLNYLSVNDPSLEGSLIIKLDVMDDNQILHYIDNFKVFYPENALISKIDQILNNDEYEHIKELFQQPVLIYFIALSNINIIESDSKSNIYSKIFDSLAERSWDNNGQLNYIKVGLSAKKYAKFLRQYIRSIAFEIYQSPSLHISIKKLNDLEATSQFVKKCFNEDIGNDSEKIKNISKYLLISFYFQQSNKNQDEDTAIEFFHNSLWEYLTAEYMWEENKRIVLNIDEDDDLKAVNVEEYFNLLKKLIGNKNLEEQIRVNLENIILNEQAEINKKISKQTENVFYKLIDKDVLLTYDWKSELLTSTEKSLSIFELLWTFFYRAKMSSSSRLFTNEKLNALIFSRNSNLCYQYTFINVDFAEEMFSTYFLSECFLEDVTFNFTYSTVTHLRKNIFLNSRLKQMFLANYITENNFERVSFENIHIDSRSVLNQNTFIDCSFHMINLPNVAWLRQFMSENSIDKSVIQKHKIIWKKSETFNGEKRIDYFIVSKV